MTGRGEGNDPRTQYSQLTTDARPKAPDPAPLLSTKELAGWLLFVVGAALAIFTGYRAGGINAALGALSASFTAAAAVLGVSAARNTTGRQP